MPLSIASLAELILTGLPSKIISPPSGLYIPNKHFMSVDLPAPFSPIKA